MELVLKMDESDKSYFSENCCEEYTAECDFPGIADYGNGMFLKLRDCGISGTANSDFGRYLNHILKS